MVLMITLTIYLWKHLGLKCVCIYMLSTLHYILGERL